MGLTKTVRSDSVFTLKAINDEFYRTRDYMLLWASESMQFVLGPWNFLSILNFRIVIPGFRQVRALADNYAYHSQNSVQNPEIQLQKYTTAWGSLCYKVCARRNYVMLVALLAE